MIKKIQPHENQSLLGYIAFHVLVLIIGLGTTLLRLLGNTVLVWLTLNLYSMFDAGRFLLKTSDDVGLKLKLCFCLAGLFHLITETSRTFNQYWQLRQAGQTPKVSSLPGMYMYNLLSYHW